MQSELEIFRGNPALGLTRKERSIPQLVVTRDDASAPLAIFKVDLVVLLSIASGVSYQTADSQGTLSIRRADQEIDAKFESPGQPPVRWQANLDDFLNALNNFRSTGV
jgi:hypothetical protein